MPAWWGKKSSKHRDDPDNNSFINNHKSKSSSPSASSSSIKKSKDNNNNKPNKSFDEVSAAIFKRNSPHTSKEFLLSGGGSSGFSGFDSDNGLERKGHPLPLPIASSMTVMMDLGIGGSGLVSGSGSISSVSSSGCSDDQLGHDLVNFDVPRSNGEITFIRSPRSPGPGPRGVTNSTLPLHPRLCGVNLESTAGEGRSQCHRLPLPPGSPTSPSSSALPTTRNSGVIEVSPGVLSKWKKGKLLGRGTFGQVYLGFNSESGQMCAIKEVRVVSDDPTSKECLKQLNQEINLLSQLSNPNIVQYHGSELSEETLSVYLEYVSGGSIHKLLQEYGAFKEPVIQNYTRQIVSGLAYLHGGNTVHRDIKGANILVDPNGEIKLADFGMAKHISSCTSMLSFKGSPYWMAPEVVMNANGYSVAVDIWSLGCTILEMATSKPPWSQYEGVAAIFKIGNSRDIPEIPNHLSSDAKSFVKLCLQRDPSARPSSSQLLDHPFIRDQATTRVANINITRDAFPFTFDGSRTPTALDILSTRKSINLCDVDYATKQGIPVSRTLNSPRYNKRMITSLPVSPCSSPLRQYGPAYKSCFLSPPHPSYAISGQSSNHSSPHPMRPTSQYPFDPWQQEVPFFKSPVPEGSPRRLI